MHTNDPYRFNYRYHNDPCTLKLDIKSIHGEFNTRSINKKVQYGFVAGSIIIPLLLPYIGEITVEARGGVVLGKLAKLFNALDR